MNCIEQGVTHRISGSRWVRASERSQRRRIEEEEEEELQFREHSMQNDCPVYTNCIP